MYVCMYLCRLLIKCNVDYPSLDLYAHVVGFRLSQGGGTPCQSGQGSYRIWKTWKVMESKSVIFQAWKVMEFNRLLTAKPWKN